MRFLPRFPAIFELTNVYGEMTGLCARKDKIIEVAAIITDENLKPLHSGFERVIHCPEEIMNNMDQWCTEHHRNVSPLTTRGRKC